MGLLDKASEIAENLKDKADDMVDAVGAKLPEGMKDKLDDAKEKISDVAHKIGDKLPGGVDEKIEDLIPGDTDGDGH
jgi:hypothetical protein